MLVKRYFSSFLPTFSVKSNDLNKEWLKALRIIKNKLFIYFKEVPNVFDIFDKDSFSVQINFSIRISTWVKSSFSNKLICLLIVCDDEEDDENLSRIF